jgi:hypothetical protein
LGAASDSSSLEGSALAWPVREQEEARLSIERNFEKLRRQQTGRGGLLNFVRYLWHALEPKSRKMRKRRNSLRF